MFNLTKKQTIIMVILIVIIVLIIAGNIFLFINYQNRQKAATDIAKINQIIADGKLGEIDIDQLKAEGLSPEALDLAENAWNKFTEEAQIAGEEYLMGTQMNEPEQIKSTIIEYIESPEPAVSQEAYDAQINSKIIALGDKAIPALEDMLTDSRENIKLTAHFNLWYFAFGDDNKKQNILPYLKKGLTDQSFSVRLMAATHLVWLGEIDGLPILIEALGHSEMIDYLHESAALYAYKILKDKTSQNFILDHDQWLEWWQENNQKLKWDEKTRKFLPL
jgi:hypothetical protein